MFHQSKRQHPMSTDSQMSLYDALPVRVDWRLSLHDGLPLTSSSMREDGQDGVCLLVADISNLLADPPLQTEALQHLSRYRREKVEACGNARNRALSIGVGLLLDRMLSGHNLHENEMDYHEGEHGKPTFTNHPELAFNLSHSGSLVAAALVKVDSSSTTTPQIGVDLQRATRYRPEVVRRMFSPSDKVLLASATSETEREHLFAQCWCRAEAYGKATGEGLHWPFPTPSPEVILSDFKIDDNYYGCLCIIPPSVPQEEEPKR